MKPQIFVLSCFVFLPFLTACSQKITSVQATFSNIFFKPESIYLSDEAIDELPYASLYAQLGNNPRSFMVLGFAEKHLSLPEHKLIFQLKWLSAEKEMLVTQNGRLVKTVNLHQHDLINTLSNEPDPLALGLHLKTTPKKWKRVIDVAPNHFGIELNASFDLRGEATIDINDKKITALYVIETVKGLNQPFYYQNQFWLEPSTGRVLKSIEKPTPYTEHLTLTHLKPFTAEV